MSKILDLGKRWWPTILPVALFLLSFIDTSVQASLLEFGKAHPQLATLLGAIWVAIANWVRAQKPAEKPAAAPQG